jgi:hypothetical protein
MCFADQPHRNVEAYVDDIVIKTRASSDLIKDVQKLTGCMAALNRFISRLGERGLPFLKLLKH